MRSWLLLSFAAASLSLAAAAQTPAQLLAHGEADRALAVLDQQLTANPADAQALNLQCRVYFSEGQLDAAQGPCERASAAAPGNAGYHLWLGRVLGRKAEHAPIFQAYGLAKRVHAEFEQAHKLAPRDRETAEDLGEYYVEAPRIIGGGRAKALSLADEVQPWSPELAHSLRAQVAAAEKDTEKAEGELKAAGQSPGALLGLAGFYGKQGRTQDMLAAVDRAVARDTAHDDDLVSASALLTRYNQRPAQAIALLRSYLASANQSEDAPAFRVHAQLAKLLEKSNDSAGAQSELALAHSLASGFQQKAKDGSGE